MKATREAIAAVLAPVPCTGRAASWCPVCGKCTCPRIDNPRSSCRGERLEYSATCPLHGEHSQHAEGMVEE